MDKESDKNQNVMFVCTRCKQLLKLDNSFNEINEEDLEDYTKVKYDSEARLMNLSLIPINNKLPSSDKLIEQNFIPTEKASHIEGNDEEELLSAPPKDIQQNSNSFTVISEGNNVEVDCLGFRMSSIVQVFDIMSENSDIEHPLCEECTDFMLETLNTEVRALENQTNSYRDYYQSLQSEETSGISFEELKKEIKTLEQEQQNVLKELEAREAERKEVIKERQELEKDEERLNKEKQRKTEEYNDLRLKQLELEEDHLSVERQLEEADAEIKRLKKTNVFNATFHIWHSGPFGTINGFRLGRLPGAHIEWAEINAAWGQSVLLLASLAKKMQLKFKKYKLVPFGNQSYIESLNDKSKELPLYASGGLRFLWDTKFDHGMVAFLDCLRQFKDEVQRVNGFNLPYNIENGKIEDTGGSGASFSIKIQLNSEEQWTKALKFMLTNLKWGLASVSSQFSFPNE